MFQLLFLGENSIFFRS